MELVASLRSIPQDPLACFQNSYSVTVAKEKILSDHAPISNIAYELGFKYPQHFTRLFKQHVGSTPTEFRNNYLHSVNS